MHTTILALGVAGALALAAAPGRADEAPPAPPAPAAPAPALDAPLALPAPPAPPPAAVVERCACPEPCCERGWTVWVEGLLLRFYPTVSDWAQDGDATGTFPTGRIHEADFDHDPGLRAGFVYRRPGSRAGLGVQVTWVESDLTADAAAPAGGSLALTHNTANGTDFLTGATATHAESIDYLVVDAGFVAERDLGAEGRATVWGGARFAHIDRTSSDAIVNGLATETVDARTDLTAFGLVSGGELRWRLCGGWSVWGRASSGILLASIEGSLVDVLNGNTLVSVGNDLDRIVPFVEMGVGLGWGCPRFLGSCVGLEVDAGFELGNWFNVLDPLSYVDDVKDSTVDQESDDLGWSAFHLRVTLTF